MASIQAGLFYGYVGLVDGIVRALPLFHSHHVFRAVNLADYRAAGVQRVELLMEELETARLSIGQIEEQKEAQRDAAASPADSPVAPAGEPLRDGSEWLDVDASVSAVALDADVSRGGPRRHAGRRQRHPPADDRRTNRKEIRKQASCG